MKILNCHAESEFTVKGSRFLSELFPCATQADARNIIKSQKAKYPDATHVVHAFVLGLSGEILGLSDDGEPSGTAGRPALDVLKGSGCTNLVLTVTRWFGGTLLGTGGLVKAYGDGAKQVLLAAEKLSAFEEYVEKKEFSFVADYTSYQVIKRILEGFTVSELTEEFGTDVKVSGKTNADEFALLSRKIKDASNGRILLDDAKIL